MGANSRDRVWEASIRHRVREVRALDQQGLALHLIVAGERHFNDRSFVAKVLDRIHTERGIASLCYCDSRTRATSHADSWARSRLCRVFWLPPERILRHKPLHGVVAFDGPDDFIERARAAGLIVWHVAPRPIVRAEAPEQGAESTPRPQIPSAISPFAHLLLRGPGQSEEWKKRESERRAGRNRKDWWKACPPPAPDDPRFKKPDA